MRFGFPGKHHRGGAANPLALAALEKFVYFFIIYPNRGSRDYDIFYAYILFKIPFRRPKTP